MNPLNALISWLTQQDGVLYDVMRDADRLGMWIVRTGDTLAYIYTLRLRDDGTYEAEIQQGAERRTVELADDVEIAVYRPPAPP